MWQRDTRTENEIYTEIAEGMISKFKVLLPECGEGIDFIADEIFKAKFDSDKATHCFFSPSKSNGWVACPAYLDRAKQWDGTKEPAIRGTIVHHFLSKAIGYLKANEYSRQFDWTSAIVFQNPDWISEPGVNSALALLKKVIELGTDGVLSEVFLLSDDLGIPNKNLRFGGSIDVLHIRERKDDDGTKYGEVHIYDLKTGKNLVSPDSWQLKCYALLVRDWLVKTRRFAYCNFTLGISQDGIIKESPFTNLQRQAEEFMAIKRAMLIYKDEYLANHLNVDIDDRRDMEFPRCFNPCPYCRFCRGCFKRDGV